MSAIKSLRKLCDITQDELSAKTGVNSGQISRMEHGKVGASRKQLQRMADYFTERGAPVLWWQLSVEADRED